MNPNPHATEALERALQDAEAAERDAETTLASICASQAATLQRRNAIRARVYGLRAALNPALSPRAPIAPRGEHQIINDIKAVMVRAGVNLSRHRDDQLGDLLQQALAREPVAWGIFADIPDEGWVLQFPNYRERVDAERAAGTFTSVAVIEVRPLYA